MSTKRLTVVEVKLIKGGMFDGGVLVKAGLPDYEEHAGLHWIWSSERPPTVGDHIDITIEVAEEGQ